MAATWDFKLLYDSECPFCKMEVDWLKRRDKHDRLETEDIMSEGFDPATYGLTEDQVHARLHGVLPDGTVTEGMESVRRSYRAVGLGWTVGWTAWPILSWFANLGYRIFARYRVPLGRLFGRKCTDACAPR
ncbi:MAG: DUF393 domain-containing protein [Planctomycetota bacterium]